jgi:basic amino acid/polyamine antiporter, APA family
MEPARRADPAPAHSATASVAGHPADSHHVGELKRAIAPGMLVLFVVGDILGAGIYARVGAVAGEVGGAIWTSFLLGIAIAALTALSYGELASKYPGAGGAALFVHKAFRTPVLTFIIAFAVLASGISSASAVARVFGGRYLQEFVVVPALPVAILFVLAMALINFRGISESIKVNMFLTLVELSGLLLIIVVGIVALAGGTGDPGRAFTFKEGANIPLGILAGAAIAFYACLGFEDVANVAEEAQDPVRMLPIALIAGLGIAGLLYVVVSFTAAMVVDPGTLSKSSGPLLEVVKAGPVPIPPRLFSAIALMAVANTALINMIMASRLLYGMAEQGVMPRVLGWTHKTRQTPWVAIVFTTLLALGLVITGDVGELANTTVLLLLISFTLVNVSVLILRRDRVGHRHFAVPSWVPVLGAVTCLALITQFKADIFVRAAILLAVGGVLWGINFVLTRRFQAGAEAQTFSKSIRS